jgi:hypothetical protein
MGHARVVLRGACFTDLHRAAAQGGGVARRDVTKAPGGRSQSLWSPQPGPRADAPFATLVKFVNA